MRVQDEKERREALGRFIAQTARTSVATDVAKERFPGTSFDTGMQIKVAEDGTFKYVPAQAWTNTENGWIYLREGLFAGLPEDDTTRQMLNYISRDFYNGDPVRVDYYASDLRRWVADPDVTADVLAKVARTGAAAFGVLGHEILHAAYSEHTMRDAWQMVLEDLRIESIWMSLDPVRARQALRACATHWVASDTSPMLGDPKVDTTRLRSMADVLHLYLLIVGRARIGVLADDSALVRGVRDIAEDALGWATCSDADDILDRFLETDTDPKGAEGIAERAALARELAALLPEPPSTGTGCWMGDPEKAEEEGEESTGSGSSESTEDEESEPGTGASGGGEEEADEADAKPSTGGESVSGGGSKGEKPAQTAKDGKPKDAGAKDSSDKPGDDADGGATAKSHGEKDDEGEDEALGDEGEDEGEDGWTIAHGSTPGESTGSQGGKGDESAPNWLTGEVGGQAAKTSDDAPERAADDVDVSEARRLDPDMVQALADVLASGLKEITEPTEGGAGWAMDKAEVDKFFARTLMKPRDAAAAVFSVAAKRALTRRMRSNKTVRPG